MKFKIGDNVRIKGKEFFNPKIKKHSILGTYCPVEYVSINETDFDCFGCNGFIVDMYGTGALIHVNGKKILFPLSCLEEASCEYCNDEAKVLTVVKQGYYPDVEISIIGDELIGGDNNVKINYCPMCARKLNND